MLACAHKWSEITDSFWAATSILDSLHDTFPVKYDWFKLVVFSFDKLSYFQFNMWTERVNNYI